MFDNFNLLKISTHCACSIQFVDIFHGTDRRGRFPSSYSTKKLDNSINHRLFCVSWVLRKKIGFFINDYTVDTFWEQE